MNHSTWWLQAGNLIRVEHRVVGDFLQRKRIARFVHQYGWAEYDGREWTTGQHQKVGPNT